MPVARTWPAPPVKVAIEAGVVSVGLVEVALADVTISLADVDYVRLPMISSPQNWNLTSAGYSRDDGSSRGGCDGCHGCCCWLIVVRNRRNECPDHAVFSYSRSDSLVSEGKRGQDKDSVTKAEQHGECMR